MFISQHKQKLFLNNAFESVHLICFMFEMCPVSLIKHCFWVLFLVAFNMYDLDGDNMISREELLSVLHMMVGANISEEQASSNTNNNTSDSTGSSRLVSSGKYISNITDICKVATNCV